MRMPLQLRRRLIGRGGPFARWLGRRAGFRKSVSTGCWIRAGRQGVNVALLRGPANWRSHECERCTQECVRHSFSNLSSTCLGRICGLAVHRKSGAIPRLSARGHAPANAVHTRFRLRARAGGSSVRAGRLSQFLRLKLG